MKRAAAGKLFMGMAGAMIPWLCYLSVSLPATATAAHWSAAWVGLDSCEALALFGTGWFLLRDDGRCALTATAACALLGIDAWFDVTTSAPGAELAVALAMAVFVEIPLSLLCGALALRVLRALAQTPAFALTDSSSQPQTQSQSQSQSRSRSQEIR